MKKCYSGMKRILALLIVFALVAGLVPAPVLEGFGAVIAGAAENTDSLELNNGYIRVTVSEKTGGFGIRTVEGDKVNKSDNDKYLVFEYDEDNTSFTSFRVTRAGVVKEYIFGGKYPGSSPVSVVRNDGELTAVWSVDDLTFTQTLGLANPGSTEHGTVMISYAAENHGAPAKVECRVLMDTALGYQDYAYYRVGSEYLEREILLGEDGYDKSFYAVSAPSNPAVTAYTINGSVDGRESKPYQVIFAHWNNLASAVFDYTPDETMTFTNFNNRKYLTSDSAFALYYDLGELSQEGKNMVAVNYGVYSNESMKESSTMAVNVNAPDVIQYEKNADGSENQSAYENGGRFSVKTHIKNIAEKPYTDIRIVVTTAGCVKALDQKGQEVETSLTNPYSMVITDVLPGEQMDIDWNFQAVPQESGQYSRIQFKVYDVSEEATLGSGQIMQENLLGEGSSYLMCPGSVTKLPVLKFTGSSPDTVFTSGIRNLNVTGDNFSMLLDKSVYQLRLSRVDGAKIDGKDGFVIPADQFQIDDSTNVISLILNDENPGTLPEGRYQITVDYLDPDEPDISGPALQFQVSNEEKFRNDTYGFLAVVKSDDGRFTYTIEHFLDEEAYWNYLDNGSLKRENVILEFQGLFSQQKRADGSHAYLGVSNNDSHNVMTLNGALDIRSGTCTITETNGSVKVDFDADIYTTGSNTYVHTGVAALTELEKGEDYALIPYSEDGERQAMTADTIALLWPSVGRVFQNVAGLLFDFRYAELGVIAHEGAPSARGSQTRLVGFGAAMDLSFLIPSSTDKQVILGKTGTTKEILGTNYDVAEHNSIQFSAEEIRALNRRASYNSTTANTNASMSDVDMGRFSDVTVDDTPGYNSASIVIDDILFGGEYLGVNMELALGLPPYIMNMPALECVLSIHTVGDWSFGVEGQCHFASFKMQASIEIVNKDDIPIVDSLHFFIGGITPGINIDTVGVLWLQGAGGGIENVYETIFVPDTLPPLKLIIQAQFSVMQLFSAVASLGLSLRGVDITLTNGRFTERTNEQTGVITQPQPITMDAGVRLDWYPEFYFHGYVNMILAMCITGGGYVVADADGFYEFFLRAGVQVPTDVPVIGGYEVVDMNLGVNHTKVWGKLDWLDLVTVALTYYWGGEIDWGSGEGVEPTYPELLGMSTNGSMLTVPLEYDARTGRTLFMELGHNVRVAAATAGAGLSGISDIGDELESDVINGSLHSMLLTKNGSGKILSIQWPSDDAEQARAEAESVGIASAANSARQIPIKIWSKDDAAGANANFSYDPKTQTAYLTVIFAADDATVFGTRWNIMTPEQSQLVIYDVLPMAEVTASAALTDNRISLQLHETQPGAFTSVTVVAEGTKGQSYLLGGARNPFADGDAALSLTMPEQAVSDTYTLRIVCKDDDALNYHEEDVEITYINPNQPNAPTGVTVENAGGYRLMVNAAASGDYDGFHFTAYDAKGNVVNGMSGILLNKDGSEVRYDENGLMADADTNEISGSYLIGGHFEQHVLNDKGEEELLVTGLSAGDYTIEVRTWKKVAGGAAALVSEPVTASVTVRQPVDTQITVTAASVNGGSVSVDTVSRPGGASHVLTTVADSDVLLRLSSLAETFSGKWRVDGGFREDLRGEIPAGTQNVNLTLKDLDEGQHMFFFQGMNQYGDPVSISFQFAVDILGPRMLLKAPVNGALFDYWTGDLEISGITDRNVSMTVMDNTTGKALMDHKMLEVEEGGHFRCTVHLDRAILTHELTITLTDPAGNASTRSVSVMSNGLGSIEKLMIYSGDSDVTNTKLTAGGTYNLKLMAQLKQPEGAENAEPLAVLVNSAGMVDWVRYTAEGDSSQEFTHEGILLTTSSDAEGMVTARFLVSDEGSYDVCAAFGYTGGQIRSLDSTYTQIIATDQLYTGEPRTTELQVWYRGVELVEGTDYTVGAYTNNVEVSTDDSKARVEIIGMGMYSGTAMGEFNISYLPLDESWIGISGTPGSNGWYVSDVSLIPADGYEFVVDGESAQIQWAEDGEHTATFRVRRLSDGALTDLVTRSASIDKTAPTGTIRLDETLWSSFLEFISFGFYKVNNLAAEVEAQDNVAVGKIEYVITSQAYTSATELAAAELTWNTYSQWSKPTIAENEDQVIYVRITDTAGNVTYLGTDGIHVDTIAPQTNIEITGCTSGSVSFTITSTEHGTYYYEVRKASEPAPTVEELKSGTSGSFSAEKSAELTVSGLSPAVTYVIYAVSEDTVVMLSTAEAAPNTGTVAASAPVTLSALSFNETNTQITVEDMLYTGLAAEPAVKVVYEGTELKEGIDYTVEYLNNVEVSEDQPHVRITGMGKYSGTLTQSFSISYLPLDEGWIDVSGIAGRNGWYVSDVSLIPADGYEFVVGGEKAQLQWSEEGVHTTVFRVRRLSDGAMTDLVERTISIDKTAPTGSVTVDTNVWKEFLNTVTFGLFFNKTKEAQITAEDAVSSVASVGYVVTQQALEHSELKMQSWSEYTGPVELAADGNYVVYAKLTDQAGNITYISTDGMVIDTVAPVVTGIVDGETYEGEIVFTIEEDYIDFVSINGVPVTGVQHILRPMDEIQTILVRDKAGNETVLNVRIVGCAGAEECPSLGYVDLNTDEWYHLSVDYVLDKGLMTGYGNKRFGPNDRMSRAMTVQVLYNLEGRPAVSAESRYTDVPEEIWFTDAIVWATENGIVNGYGNSLFGPNDPVTREQMAAIFYRYSRFAGYSLHEGSYDHFEDRDLVSAYAQQAMRWAVGNGLIVGMDDGLLCPGCHTRRVEFATVIQRFCETIAK